MTEDDTFEALKRTPFDKVHHILDVWTEDMDDNRHILTILHSHGWKLREYNRIARSKGVNIAAYESEIDD